MAVRLPFERLAALAEECDLTGDQLVERRALDPAEVPVLHEAAAPPAGHPHQRPVALRALALPRIRQLVPKLVVGREQDGDVHYGAARVKRTARAPDPGAVACPLIRARSSVASDHVSRTCAVR